MIAAVLVRFAYLAVSRAFSALRLLRMTDREKVVEILALRHQLTVLRRQLGDQRPRLRPEDRALLAALLVPLARARLRRLRLLVSPVTVLRWHRDLMKRRHARTSVNRGPGRPRTVASIRRLVLLMDEFVRKHFIQPDLDSNDMSYLGPRLSLVTVLNRGGQQPRGGESAPPKQ
jgi:hypothetical protein